MRNIWNQRLKPFNSLWNLFLVWIYKTNVLAEKLIFNVVNEAFSYVNISFLYTRNYQNESFYPIFKFLLLCYEFTMGYFVVKKLFWDVGNVPWNYTPSSIIPPPLQTKYVLYKAAILSFALDLRSQWSPWAVCSCLRYLRSLQLYLIKNIYGGGLITLLGI